MTALHIDSAFDSGNIELLGRGEGGAFDLAIRRDRMSDFYQWFHFRVTGARGVPLELRILNAGGSAYAYGWPNYRARVSDDRRDWVQTDTAYADGVLTIRHTPATDSCWFAYHAPYPIERHHDLIARAAAAPGVQVRTLGRSLDGQAIDAIELGDGGPPVWLIARQHPGESMAEWWMEGAIDALIEGSALARSLRSRVRFHIVPNMNPDGSVRGHLRTNAAGVNLNRVWHAPNAETEPEVACVLAHMERTGVHFAMDVHGDETIPHLFMAGFEGIPNATPQQAEGYRRYLELLGRHSADFQTRVGYEIAAPGTGNLTMATNAIAHRFGAVAMTLEMPFKDALENPDPVRGWSPARSKALGRACLSALADWL
ncbi:MAG: M14-type cytosolic carboxypeptidase [Sphingomonadaceae bacterium]|nr:M14-type cytosolic carboxypeptidase [Sphingomonadaceae bacterium]